MESKISQEIEQKIIVLYRDRNSTTGKYCSSPFIRIGHSLGFHPLMYGTKSSNCNAARRGLATGLSLRLVD